MSDTIKRKVFFQRVGGQIAFYDWAIVTSINGDMIEPLSYPSRFANDDSEFDPTEASNLITEMIETDLNKIANMPPFADVGGGQWHGGPIRTKTF